LEQLLFNKSIPAVSENMAVRFSTPRPIVIEKMKATSDQKNLPLSVHPSTSSGVFSVISEERLKLAMWLAKRDIKLRHLEEQRKQQVFGGVASMSAQDSQEQKSEVMGNKNALRSQTHLKCQQKFGQPSKVQTTTPGTKVYVYTPNEGQLIPAVSPTCSTGLDSKPNVNKKEDKNVQEVRRLQKELRRCVQKIEELTEKGREREILDPDKEQQVCTRRQKQAARSARMLYVLQQQVKEIQDDLEKLSTHKIKHTKKSQAVSRLAAAHRGAVRALQVFANQFTDQTEQWIPTHYKELGNLIRQLSLCSAKLEVDSSISDIILDILLQVEDLDSLLEKKQATKKLKKYISASQGKSPNNNEVFPARKHFTSPKGENKHLILKRLHGQEHKKPPAARTLLTDKHLHLAKMSTVEKASSCAHILHNKFREETDPPTPERNATLQGSTDALAKARAPKKDPVLGNGPFKRKGVLLPTKSQGVLKSLKSRQVQGRGKPARFQETTIAFQLKQNKRLNKESRKSRMSPAPTSPPVSPKRYVLSLGDPVFTLLSCGSAVYLYWQMGWICPVCQAQRQVAQHSCCQQLHCEVVKLARLEAETSRGKNLTDLSRGEMKKLQELSAFPMQCADKAEKAIWKHLDPLLDRTQEVATDRDILCEKLLDDLLEDTAQELWSMEQRESLQALPITDIHSLESMLQRMEEIERYQQAVRRRFTQIVYGDLEFCTQEGKTEQQVASIAKRPTSPHPIQITKCIGYREPERDILYEKLFDSNDTDENKETEEKLQTGNDILKPLTRNSLRCVSLSMPKQMLQSILDYNNRYRHHLKLISHEAVGSFDPWQVAESLAEQLTEEVLCDVAAELEDVCEDYAEAVFTSEFLQPAQ
ncbi:MOONR protein, partial [Turnix velox]|nr:MOONR protein [Turnix velox]